MIFDHGGLGDLTKAASLPAIASHQASTEQGKKGPPTRPVNQQLPHIDGLSMQVFEAGKTDCAE